ncbi:MAG: serine protease [Planctomycetota bacterium]|nr:MAG: serine protease [Planctomycetota bacterium]
MDGNLDRRVTVEVARWVFVLRGAWCMVVWAWLVLAGLPSWAEDAGLGSANRIAVEVELKTVKLYGAGGFRGLDAYQSGFFISDTGHILTVWSTVLDVDRVVAVGSDGSRYEASVVGIDPNLEIAVLTTGTRPPAYFDLDQAVEGQVGWRVLAVSNLFGIATGAEMSSVQRGVIMAITDLQARRGTIESVYRGPVYVLDTPTNNPGAAGGALVDLQGRLLGILGKELRDTRANIWLNYAIPISQVRSSVQKIMQGESIQRLAESRQPVDRPMDLDALGIVLVPDVLAKTPPYIDGVYPGSRAAEVGLQPDDLILFVNNVRIASQADLRDELKYIDRADRLVMLVQRGNQLVEIVLNP